MEAKAIGWMADFAEYTPMDVLYEGYDGDAYTYHNKYPYEWAKANQETIEEMQYENDEIVYFMRAGSTHSPSVTSLYWMGDQLPTFDKFDGLHSALIGMLNGGISGFGIGHSDIGGYTSLNDTEHLRFYQRD
jgi:alpha-glucosidase